MRVAAFVAAAVVAALSLPPAAHAALKPFVGPAGWDHAVQGTPSPGAPHAQETWKKSDGESLVELDDGDLSYDDTIALVQKNIASNGLHPAINRDRTCAGGRAHELEETFGTSIVHQLIVDDNPGVTKLTYIRAAGQPVDPAVSAAFAAYCGS